MNAPKVSEMPVAAVRMPEELLQWFRHQAVENRRSLSAELAHRLDESRRQQEAANAQPS